MLDGLSVGDHAGIEHVGILGLLHVLLALLEDALDGRAGLGRGLEVAEREDLLEALDLAFRLFEMMLERLAQSSESAFLAIFGSAFRICFSA